MKQTKKAQCSWRIVERGRTTGMRAVWGQSRSYIALVPGLGWILFNADLTP
jgi:hypothetical protein